MTKVLVCGLCPLPFENTTKSFGPGIRTWQMARSLAQAGHEVRLVAMRIPGAYENGDEIGHGEQDGVHIERLSDAEFFAEDAIRGRIEEFVPEAVVGATVYGSHVLALAKPEVPFWADQFGHVMAEAQAKAHLEQANWPLAHFWNLLRPILLGADRFSTVSERQRWALVGELGLVGRLTSETCGYEFTSEMPCALVPAAPQPTRPILRGNELPSDAFVVLWSGGYNVWSDVDTLFDALELAMAQEPRVHFVSTGGEIGGHDETTYRRFEDRIEHSSYGQRFHLQGWVRAELVPSYQEEADIGVLSEIPMYEGQLGSKNRIVQWMGSGLPVIYNQVGDLGNLLQERQMGLTFAVGDAQAMAQHILWAAQQPSELGDMAERARTYTCEQLSFEATTQELLTWAAAPSFAPDLHLRHHHASPADFAASPSEPPSEPPEEPPAVATNGANGEAAEPTEPLEAAILTPAMVEGELPNSGMFATSNLSGASPWRRWVRRLLPF